MGLLDEATRRGASSGNRALSCDGSRPRLLLLLLVAAAAAAGACRGLGTAASVPGACTADVVVDHHPAPTTAGQEREMRPIISARVPGCREACLGPRRATQGIEQGPRTRGALDVLPIGPHRLGDACLVKRAGTWQAGRRRLCLWALPASWRASRLDGRQSCPSRSRSRLPQCLRQRQISGEQLGGRRKNCAASWLARWLVAGRLVSSTCRCSADRPPPLPRRTRPGSSCSSRDGEPFFFSSRGRGCCWLALGWRWRVAERRRVGRRRCRPVIACKSQPANPLNPSSAARGGEEARRRCNYSPPRAGAASTDSPRPAASPD